MERRFETLWVTLALVTLLPLAPALAKGEAGSDSDLLTSLLLSGHNEKEEFCATDLLWSLKSPTGLEKGAACATEGDCDVPATRDDHLLDDEEAIKFVRLRFVVVAEDDGTNPAATPAEIDAQVDQLNADLAPYRFQVVHTTVTVNDSRFRTPPIMWLFNPGVAVLKSDYAEDPESQINVFVALTSPFFGGFGTFPWDPDTLTDQGGIVMDQGHVQAANSVLTHEVGHNLGLWHTHHGVSEIQAPVCDDDCYEEADDPDADFVGDFCSDTPATPVNTSCNPVAGSDACSGNLWEPTLPESYMSYGLACWDQFTDQQAARMHCWSEDVTSGWFAKPPGGAGDVDGDGDIDQADVDALLAYLFTGGAPPSRDCRADVNGNGTVNIGDAIDLINYIFQGGSAPVQTCDREPGDANDDAYVDGDDPTYILDYLFASGPAPDPLCFADVNDDGSVNSTDAIYLLNFLNLGGAAPLDACP